MPTWKVQDDLPQMQLIPVANSANAFFRLSLSLSLTTRNRFILFFFAMRIKCPPSIWASAEDTALWSSESLKSRSPAERCRLAAETITTCREALHIKPCDCSLTQRFNITRHVRWVPIHGGQARWTLDFKISLVQLKIFGEEERTSWAAFCFH